MRFQHPANIFPESFAYRDLGCTNTNKVSFDCCNLGYCRKEGLVSTYKGAGRAGAIVALKIGLTGVILGGLALARYRRIARGSSTTATSYPHDQTSQRR